MPFDSTTYLEPSTLAETVTLPIYLPAWKVIEEGRKAYLEGRLSAQGPTPECRYRDKSGRPCIVGAAISDAEIAAMDPQDLEFPVSGCSDIFDSDDFITLQRLQDAHDLWANPLNPVEARADGESELRALLDL